MQFSEAIIPLVSVLTVISSLLIHWNSLDASSKRWRIVLLGVLVIVAIAITVSCIGYEVNRKSAEEELSGNGARFELVTEEEFDKSAFSIAQTPMPEGTASISNETNKDWLDLKELREAPYKDYGYRFIDAHIFFVANATEVRYAKPIKHLSKSDIDMIHQGYDIWARYSYSFTSATKEELAAVVVEYVLFMPNNEYVVYCDGTLGDGSRIEYEQEVMPSVTTFFENSQSWSPGRYSLCLLLSGKYAGESQFEILDSLNE